MAPLPSLLLAALATCAAAADPAIDPEKLRASAEAIGKTRVQMYDLIDQSDQGMQWTPSNVADLGEALKAASKAVAELHAAHPSAVADAYGNGSMTNIEDTFKLFGGGNLERGCISHQATTFDAVKPLLAKSTLIISTVPMRILLMISVDFASSGFTASKVVA